MQRYGEANRLILLLLWSKTRLERVMTKLDMVKQVITAWYKLADCGIFNTRNILGDPMDTICSVDGVTIDICLPYSYFEVFGLTHGEFEQLESYYRSLGGEDDDTN